MVDWKKQSEQRVVQGLTVWTGDIRLEAHVASIAKDLRESACRSVAQMRVHGHYAEELVQRAGTVPHGIQRRGIVSSLRW